MSVTDEIKARLDIVNYIQQYAPLKKAGRNFKACCPFHAEKTPSFTVNPDSQSWRCFGACSEGGDIFSFAMKQHGFTFVEALKHLGDMAGVETEQRSPEQRQRDDYSDKLRGLLQTASDFYHELLINGASDDVRKVQAYVAEKRGLNAETVKQFGIGYAPDGWQNILEALTNLGYSQDDVIASGMAIKNDNGRVYDRFRNRLMIPIRDSRGRVVGFGARALNPEDNPKYLNSPQTAVFDKSRTLFGLDVAKGSIRDTETAVIVEGYMDVIQAHQAGFKNVVAQMGTAMTDTQLKSIAPRYAKKIVMALDADAAGQSATRRSLETARQTLVADYTGKLSIDIRVLQIPDAKDPDDLLRESPDEWQTLVDNALPVADFVIQMEMADLPDQPTVQEREAVARQILPILVASESNLYTQDNIQKLALKLRIPERDLLRWSQEKRQTDSVRPAPPPRVSNDTPDFDDGAPPIDYDDLEPPPFLDDDDYQPLDVGIPQTRPIVTPLPPREDSLEIHCLRILFLNPKLYYDINRKFRELAGDNQTLLEGPLCDLCHDDFIRTEHRVLIDCFIDAAQQDDLEMLEFLERNLEDVFQNQLEVLLLGESERLHGRVRQKFGGDFGDIWKKHTQGKTSDNHHVELLKKTLQLRLERLKRELDELSFLQRDAQDASEMMVALNFGAQIMLSAQARRLIDREISDLTAKII